MSIEQTAINEISAMFNNPDNVRNDFTEAYGIMKEHFHKKYLDKMIKVIENCEIDAVTNPSNEVRLLKALKPFTKAESKGQLDNCINLFQKLNTIKEVRSRLDNNNQHNRNLSTASADINLSVHEDGIYDIDENCMVNKQKLDSGFGNISGLLMMMAMLNQNK